MPDRPDPSPRDLATVPLVRTSLTVLVVEDEPDARAFVTRLLTDRGLAVVAVESAVAALAAYEARRPDLIGSDIGMSGVDGYAFLRELRRREEARGAAPIPAIALTAYDDTARITEAGRAGFERYLPKPVSPRRLLDTVLELSGGRGLADPTSPTG